MTSKTQHYPPGTQENYNSFSSRDLMMEKGKELEYSRRAGGGKGLEILRISEEPGVPPRAEDVVDNARILVIIFYIKHNI
jgi:hypothetical protein